MHPTYLFVVLDVNHQDPDQALLPPRIVQLPSVPISTAVKHVQLSTCFKSFTLDAEAGRCKLFPQLEVPSVWRVPCPRSPVSKKQFNHLTSGRKHTWHFFLPRGTNQLSCLCLPLLKPSGSCAIPHQRREKRNYTTLHQVARN